MICECPNCVAALIYDPSAEKMTCPYCGEVFEVADVATEALEESQTMTCDIYGCTACGAEIMVKDTEVSTFCAYCGQPTIVFNRVSKERKPDGIIPFKITRDEALVRIREKLAQGKFVPRTIKNFEVEKIRGIYIPYRTYDIYHYDRQKLAVYVKDGANREYIREAECNFKRITCDVSTQLTDEATLRLEPYDFKELKPFEVGYLSGFYADKYDVEEENAKEVALKRAKDFFDEQIRRDVSGGSCKVLESCPRREIVKSEYVLLPAWFMIFRYRNETYTLIVNGQSGEVIGAVPIDKKKVFGAMAGVTVLAWPICSYICAALLKTAAMSTVVYGFVIIWLISFIFGYTALKSVSQNVKFTKDKRTELYARERQEER